MKEIILDYLYTATKKKKVIWAMKNESWFSDLVKEYESLGIPDDWESQRKLQHYWHGSADVPKCPVTGEDRKWRSGSSTESLDLPHFNQGYAMTSGSHASQKIISSLAKNTLQEKYGVSNPMHITRNKRKERRKVSKKVGHKKSQF